MRVCRLALGLSGVEAPLDLDVGSRGNCPRTKYVIREKPKSGIHLGDTGDLSPGQVEAWE